MQETIMQVLSDPNWLAVILALVSTIVSLAGWVIRNIKRKQITIRLRFATIGLQLSEDVRGKVHITFGSKFQSVAHNIYSIILDVKNTGDKKIALGDYQPNTQIELEMGANTEILEAKEATGVGIAHSQDCLTIPCLVLERRKSITVNMLVAGSVFHIKESIQLHNVEQILRVEPLSRFNIRNHSFTAAILCILQFCLFYYASYAILGLLVVLLPPDTDQALAFSLVVGGLIATLLSIAIIFAVFDIKSLCISTRQHELIIGKKRHFFIARNLLTTGLLLIVSPCVFYFTNLVILNDAFNLSLVGSPFIGYSLLLGGIGTTLIIIGFNWLLSWLLPLREFVVD